MGYQKSNKFVRHWNYEVEINDKSNGTYESNNQIEFKTTTLISNLCDYNDAYILVKGTITITNTAAANVDSSNTNNIVIIKNCAHSIIAEAKQTTDM